MQLIILIIHLAKAALNRYDDRNKTYSSSYGYELDVTEELKNEQKISETN